MPLKAVLFDIDGTLVNSNDMHVTAWEEAFAKIDRHFERQVIHNQIGKGTDQLVPTLLPDLDDDAVEELGQAHGAIFKDRYLNRVQPFSGAHAILDYVHKRGLRVVLASSASEAELDHYLQLLDAQEIVSATTSSEDVEQTKPAPDIFATALARLTDVKADEAVVIGDTPYDIEAAAKCGMEAIAVRSGGFPDDILRGAGAIAIYDDVAALLRDYCSSPLGGSADAA